MNEFHVYNVIIQIIKVVCDMIRKTIVNNIIMYIQNSNGAYACDQLQIVKTD